MRGLLADRGLARLGLRAPGLRALDREADLIARIGERLDLVLGAEDRDGHRSVPVVAQVVVVELHPVGPRLQLEPERGRLARQHDLDQVLTLVRVDPAILVLRDRGTRQHRHGADRRAGELEPTDMHVRSLHLGSPTTR